MRSPSVQVLCNHCHKLKTDLMPDGYCIKDKWYCCEYCKQFHYDPENNNSVNDDSVNYKDLDIEHGNTKIQFDIVTDSDLRSAYDSDTNKDNIKKYGNNACPVCGGAMVKKDGCQTCLGCDYGKCDV